MPSDQCARDDLENVNFVTIIVKTERGKNC